MNRVPAFPPGQSRISSSDAPVIRLPSNSMEGGALRLRPGHQHSDSFAATFDRAISCGLSEGASSTAESRQNRPESATLNSDRRLSPDLSETHGRSGGSDTVAQCLGLSAVSRPSGEDSPSDALTEQELATLMAESGVVGQISPGQPAATVVPGDVSAAADAIECEVPIVDLANGSEWSDQSVSETEGIPFVELTGRVEVAVAFPKAAVEISARSGLEAAQSDSNSNMPFLAGPPVVSTDVDTLTGTGGSSSLSPAPDALFQTNVAPGEPADTEDSSGIKTAPHKTSGRSAGHPDSAATDSELLPSGTSRSVKSGRPQQPLLPAARNVFHDQAANGVHDRLKISDQWADSGSDSLNRLDVSNADLDTGPVLLPHAGFQPAAESGSLSSQAAQYAADSARSAAIIAQVARAMTGQSPQNGGSGRTELTLQLDPPELGTLQLVLSFEHDELRMQIVTQSEVVRGLIEARLDELVALLRDTEIEFSECQVFCDDESSNRWHWDPEEQSTFQYMEDEDIDNFNPVDATHDPQVINLMA